MDVQKLTIGIIGEGPTDHVVLEHIITGYTNNKNFVFTPLQPREGAQETGIGC